MMTIRLISFLFMFILLLRNCCSARSYHDMKKNVAVEAMVGLKVTSMKPVNLGKAFYIGVSTAAEVEDTKLGRQKMMSRESLGKEIMKEEVLNQKDAEISEKAALLRESDDEYFKNLESKKVVDAANEIGKFMNKDYPGHGGARHNPPINNNEPLNKKHVLP